MWDSTTTFASASPLRILVAVACLVLAVWMSVDVWRNRAYRTSDKVLWQLVVGGVSVGPVLRISNSFFVMVPVGAVYYLFYAESGPVRRRRPSSNGDGQSHLDRAILEATSQPADAISMQPHEHGHKP